MSPAASWNSVAAESVASTCETPPRIALLAEENEGVRAQIAGRLRRLGWRVLEAWSGMEAMVRLLDEQEEIDALFTSMDLRSFTHGKELADCLQAACPRMAVFYLEGDKGDRKGNLEEVLRKAEFLPLLSDPADAWVEAQMAG